MKKIVLVIFFIGVIVFSGGAQNPVESLFNGRDLSHHWVIPGFRVSEGIIITDSPDGIGSDLFTKKHYGNFILRFEYFMSFIGNSGVFLRCDPNNRGTCVEVQLLAPWTPTRPDLYCTGSVYGHVAVKNRPDETPGIWRHMEIKYDRKSITISVDGNLTTEADIDTVESMKDKPLIGAIGLQSNHSKEGEFVKFRNIYIRDLDTDPEYVMAGFYEKDDRIRKQAHIAALSLGTKMIEPLAILMSESNPIVSNGSKQVLFDIIAKATSPEVSNKEKKVVAEALKNSINKCSSEITSEYLKWLLDMTEN